MLTIIQRKFFKRNKHLDYKHYYNLLRGKNNKTIAYSNNVANLNRNNDKSNHITNKKMCTVLGWTPKHLF